jgi:glycosyltransferase involved in cell wall biosynthesis
MVEPRLSIIVPTTGREALSRTLASIVPQLLPGDELLVERDSSGDWGATPRTRGMRAATGAYLLWIDDDDLLLPGALDVVRRAAGEHAGRPLLFRLERGAPHNDVLPRERSIKEGEVSTQMLVAPNDPTRLGVWGPRYEGDYDFIVSTLAHYPDGPVWRDETLCLWNGARS